MNSIILFPRRVCRILWRKFSDSIWVTYYSYLRFRSRRLPEFARDPEYVKNRFVMGRLGEQTTAELSEVLQSAPRILMRRGDYLPGYRWSYNTNEEKFNAAAICYDLSGDLSKLLPAIEECAPRISAALGTAWRIVNTRAYSTIGSREAVFQGGQNTWHTDRFNAGILKVLIYLSPVGDQYGATEVRMPDGSTFITKGGPGTYLLFDPTKLVHRGLPPNGGRRDTIELVVATAPKVSKRAVQAGQNGVYPWFPWLYPATE